ncbi:hypothetical protein LVY74_00670 [Acinetobacter sp. ME22]|uniref:hypothetical protein n=1 Tax=Acinetobacter sp. ME22 TaxID=2904802 RepID=UPI001EDAC6D6|nr:hypothetical protein [Acinetobacter sp. ME22]MCG2572072.1 hypothetical protein [Acinetobacter sp. ME22]
MTQFCISYPPPSYQDLIAQIDDYTTIDFSNLTSISALIGIPIPIYPDISQYTLEFSQIVQYWQNMLSVNTLFAMIKPMVNLLGLDLAALLPQIPYLGVSILDLITIDPAQLRIQLKELLAQYGQDFINAFSAFLPIPIYYDLSISSFEINTLLKSIYNMSVYQLINICKSLIDQTLGKLKINAVLSLPTIPTLAELQEMIKGIALEKIKAIQDEIIEFENEFEAIKAALSLTDLSIPDIFALISFDGLSLITFPDPFFPDFLSYAIELREIMLSYMQAIYTQITEKIVSFVKSVLGILGISFPSLCIELPSLEQVEIL